MSRQATSQPVSQGRLKQSSRPPFARRYWAELLVVAAFVASRVWLISFGTLGGDDFVLIGKAENSGLTPAYMAYIYNGHMNPAGAVLGWFAQHALPGSAIALMATVAICQLGAALLVRAIINNLTGSRIASVTAMAFVALSAFSLEPMTWWAVGIYAGPMLLGLAGTLHFTERATALGSKRYWRFTFALYALTLLSHTRGFMTLPLIFAFSMALRPTQGSRARAAETWRASPDGWLLAGATSALYAVWVMWGIPGQAGEGWNLSTFGAFVRSIATDTLPNAVFGGPWHAWTAGSMRPGPMPLISYVCMAAIAVLIFLLLRKSGYRAVSIVMLAYIVLLVAFNASNRHGWGIAPTPYRYYFDLAVPIALLIGIGVKKAGADERRAMWLVTLALAASCLVTVSGARSTFDYNAPLREYVSNARSTIGSIPPDTVLLAQATGRDTLIRDQMGTALATGILPGSPEFALQGHGELYGFDSEGRAIKQFVAGVRTSNDSEVCTTQDRRRLRMPMPRGINPPGGEPLVRIDYSSTEPTEAEFQVGDRTTEVSLRPGFHVTHFYMFTDVVPAGTRFVTLKPVSATAQVCAGAVTMGARQALLNDEIVDFAPAPPEWRTLP